jgi:propionyl-CoA synthetase
VDCVPVAATDPLYILYTSGTTGQPKGVVRDNGGHMVALKWSMKNIYGIEPGEVFWAASDVGWVVGHSYIVYAPLLHGATTILFEGKPVGTPDAGAFWRVIAEHKVAALFTAPTAFRAIKKEDPNGEFDRQLRPVALPHAVPGRRAGRPRHDPVGRAQAEACRSSTTGGRPRPAGRSPPIRWGSGMLPVKYGSPTVPMPGYDVRVLDEDGREVPPARSAPSRQAAAAAGLPADPVERRRALPRELLWRVPGYYKTADAGYIDEDGYLYIMARTDDIINVAGHRLSTGAMEEVSGHPDVAECAVIGVADALKGQVPVRLRGAEERRQPRSGRRSRRSA